jgi:AbrB family looped-hinge helix DNA binding protein
MEKGKTMDTSVVSSKFQVVIPRKIREKFNVKPGQRVMFIPYQKSLRMVIVPSIEEAYGILEGMSTNDLREEEDEAR